MKNFYKLLATIAHLDKKLSESHRGAVVVIEPAEDGHLIFVAELGNREPEEGVSEYTLITEPFLFAESSGFEFDLACDLLLKQINTNIDQILGE